MRMYLQYTLTATVLVRSRDRNKVHRLRLQVADAAGTEVERRWNEPYRKFKLWKKVICCLASLEKASPVLEGKASHGTCCATRFAMERWSCQVFKIQRVA